MPTWQAIFLTVFLAVLGGALGVRADDLPVPPDPERVAILTCRLTGTPQGWQVKFVASYRAGAESREDWEKVYSYRRSLERGATDCRKWMEKTKKAQTAFKHSAR